MPQTRDAKGRWMQSEAEGFDGTFETLQEVHRHEGLQSLMTVNLLKRLESSVEAFRLTLHPPSFGISRLWHEYLLLFQYGSRGVGLELGFFTGHPVGRFGTKTERV